MWLDGEEKGASLFPVAKKKVANLGQFKRRRDVKYENEIE
jgi:hypothetical protein